MLCEWVLYARFFRFNNNNNNSQHLFTFILNYVDSSMDKVKQLLSLLLLLSVVLLLLVFVHLIQAVCV